MLNKIIKRLTRKAYVATNNTIISEILKISNVEIKTIFDIGAHHGKYTTELIKKIKNYKIYLFEPYVKSFNVLSGNIKDKNCRLFQIALSDKVGFEKFYINNLDETNSLLPSAVTESYIDDLTKNESITSVEVSTIDIFCNDNSIDTINLLKIDVQGNTLKVLKGAFNMLQNKKIDLIQAEIEFVEIYQNQALFHHVTKYLEELGYELYSLYNLHYDINDRLSWADAIYSIKK